MPSNKNPSLLRRVADFFSRAHKHSWINTHTNTFGVASRQVCKCGLAREVIETPHEPYEYDKAFTFWWHYSDNRPDEKDERIFPHTCELTPPNRERKLNVDSNSPFERVES